MTANELADKLDNFYSYVNEPYLLVKTSAMLRKQAEEIENLRKIVEDTIKQAFYEEDYHQLKEKFDAQTQEITQLKSKVQYWKGLHK